MNEVQTRRPRVLVLSFSNIVSDGRVLRQIEEFAKHYEVTTCGRGAHPHERVVEHISVGAKGNPKWVRVLQGVFLNLKMHRAAYLVLPEIREARRALRGRRFDAVVANDLPAAGVLRGVAPPERVLLDLHEYWPGVRDDNADWVRLRRPHYEWLLRTYSKRARHFTTVNESLARKYTEEFGFACEVVTNASSPRTDLHAQPVSQPLRLVHSGGATEVRRIDVMMRAADRCSSKPTLDLYLMGESGDCYRKLKQLEAELSDRVRILPPVPHHELVDTLNGYDVGLPFLPPTTTNIRLCLPNKFFDYVQARLAIVTGPTPPMAELLRQWDLGVVTDDFEEDALVRAIDGLDVESVRRYKANAEAAAEPLSSVSQIAVWRGLLQRMIGS